MKDESTQYKVRPWYQEPLVWLVIALPMAAVVAGISTVVIASNSSDSLVVDGFQKVGLIAKRESAADRNAQAMNLAATISIDRNTGQLTARLDADEPGTGNEAIGKLQEISVSLHHPTRRDMDRSTHLQRDAAGLFRGNIGPGASGRWYIQVEGNTPADAAWRLSGRLSGDQELVRLGSGA